MFFEEWHLRDVACQDIVSAEVTTVECEEQVAQPRVWCLIQRVEDGVEEKFAEVVNGVGDKRGDAEVVGASLAFAKVEVCKVDAGEVEERVFVVRCEFVFPLQVVSI